MPQAFEPAEIQDAVASFAQGMNAGIEPMLLPMDQLAFARNSTQRGLFLLPRPPNQKIAINYFAGDPGLQQRVETGLWQGSCYFKPDVGPECLLASISGRLYQFIPVGSTATVFDVTGNNSQTSTASQCWLWQSEAWAIWNDGINLPVFFDGNATRRSIGPSTVVGVTSGTATLPAVGSSVTITLASAYTGPVNVPVKIANLLFQILGTASITNAYQITVKTLFISNFNPEASGSSVVTKPGTIGALISAGSGYLIGAGQTTTMTISDTTGTVGLTPGNPLVPPGSDPGGSSLLIYGHTVRYMGNTATTITVWSSVQFSIPNGIFVTNPANTTPSVTVGTLSQAYTIPPVGSSGTMSLSAAYTGTATIVWVGNNQYSVQTVSGGAGGTSLNVMLLSSPNGTTTIPTATNVLSIAELPPGRMGDYGKGRNWESLTDARSYMAGDIVGGPSGVPAYNFRDAVLKSSENSYLAGGGIFSVPGPGDIRSMRFPTELDQSLGQGPLQIGTPRGVFSCNAPIDRSTWQAVTNPLQTRPLVGYGPVSQYGTVIWNNDMIFRSRNGIMSLLLARRDYNTWGPSLISNEIRPFLATDDQTLLPFTSAIVFDNRMLMTFSPVNSGQGTYFTKLAVINGDSLSSLRGKGQSIWDGIWDGLNVLQLVTGTFNEQDRAFAFNFNTDTSTIELYELLPTGVSHFDNGATKIVQEYEFPVMRFQTKARDPHQLIRLWDGELYADSIDGSTLFEVFFRADKDPVYHPWYSWTVDPATMQNWQPCMGLGEPPADSGGNLRPSREGFVFQIKVRVTGYARILGARCKAVTCTDTKYAPQIRN